MCPPEFKMPVTFPGMVDRIPICNFGKEWPWVLCQGVDGNPIKGEEYELMPTSEPIFNFITGQLTYDTREIRIRDAKCTTVPTISPVENMLPGNCEPRTCIKPIT
jgi:hypothetical protein